MKSTRWLMVPGLALVFSTSSLLAASTADITVTASPLIAGTVTGGGIYQTDTVVDLSATVTNDCYTFEKWEVSGKTVSSNLDYDFPAAKTETVEAVFVPYKYVIVVTASPTKAGTVTKGGIETCGTTLKLTAKAAKGFGFVNWTQGDVILSTSATYDDYDVSENAILTAHFADIEPPTVSITSPKSGTTTSNSTELVFGKASDNVAVEAVYYNVADTGWLAANTTDSNTLWSATVNLATGSNTVQVCAVDTSGNVSKTNSIVIIRTEAPAATYPVATDFQIQNPQAQVAFDGTNFLAVFQSQSQGSGQPTGQFFSPSGNLVGSALVFNPGGPGDPPAVAFDGNNYLVAWADGGSQNEIPVSGVFVSPNGSFGSVITLSQSTTVDNFKTIVYGDGVYFIEWADSSTSPDSIYGALVDTTGNAVSGDFLISANGDLVEAGQRSAAFDGTNFLAVWDNASGKTGVNGQLIDTAGNLVGGAFTIYTNSAAAAKNLPSVIFDGTRYLVLFNTGVSASQSSSFHVLGQFVTTSGTLQGDPFTLTSDAGPQIVGSGAFDGTNYLISWTQGFNPFANGNKSATVNARFFDAQGNALAPEFPVFTAQDDKIPVFASDIWGGTNFVLTAGLGQELSGAPNLTFTNGIIEGASVAP